jgi:hypothetical protein
MRHGAAHMRLALIELGSLDPIDDNDRLAKDFITERFETSLLSRHVIQANGNVPCEPSLPSTTLRRRSI